MRISINYLAKWQIKGNENYKWTTCKKLVNTKTNREIIKTKFGNGKEVGYYIDGNFVKCIYLKNKLEKIKEFIMVRHQKLSNFYDIAVQTEQIGDIKISEEAINKPKTALILTVAFITGFILSIFLVFFIQFIQSIKRES